MRNEEQFNLELKNSFDGLNMETEDTQIHLNNIKTSIKIASLKINQPKSKNNRLSSETLKLIEKRSITEISSDAYRTLDKTVKRSIRRDIRKHNTNLVKTALEQGKSLRAAKQGISKGRTWINSMRDENGIKQNSRDKVTDICSNFYKTLYSEPSCDCYTSEYSCTDDIPPITGSEVNRALMSMKYSKSQGKMASLQKL
ncbi:hypothetical protein NE865_05311 [Phthorimaea operculella]|nr:hypothetical protein NE865_05311 [Phthorimaea operculella]